MEKKKCFKCKKTKLLSAFYKHPAMGDGHLGKCKDCTKADTKARVNELSKDPNWVEVERTRHREKAIRLDYKNKHKPTAEKKRAVIERYWKKYPEKQASRIALGRRRPPSGMNFHHWSYCDEHLLDVILLKVRNHFKAHRFLIYDQERKMYRRSDSNELLDTKAKHKKYILDCIKNKPD